VDIVTAVEEGDLERVRELLAEDPTLASARDADGLSVLMAARYRDRADIVDTLRGAGLELDVFEAAAVGDTGRLRGLLSEEPDRVGSWSVDGFTPLHLAAFFGHPDAVRLLLEHGADVTPTSENGLGVTPLQSAVAGRDLEAVRAILDAGAEVDVREQAGFTPLHAAAQNGDGDIARLLLERGADPGARSDTGATAADLAREGGHEEVLALLEEPPA
jgi:uncharacterized protein